MDVQRSVPQRVPFKEQFPMPFRLGAVCGGAVVGLALSTLSIGQLDDGTGFVVATALVGLLAGLAASWSP